MGAELLVDIFHAEYKINILGSFGHMELNCKVLKICFLKCHSGTPIHSTFGEGLCVNILKLMAEFSSNFLDQDNVLAEVGLVYREDLEPHPQR